MKRHRTICAALQEIREIAVRLGSEEGDNIIVLIDEARTYAESMSAKLVEYKAKESKDG